MNIRTATVAGAVIFTACGCGASSPTSPSPSRPVATSSTPPSSSATTVSTQAQPATVEVSLVSVVPGTPSGDSDWCIGADEVTLTAHVLDTSQNEVAQGSILWEECDGPRGGLPKEACDGRGPGRWVVVPTSDLSFDSTPSIFTNPTVPVLGFRLSYRPAQGSGYRRATSESFNLDMACSS